MNYRIREDEMWLNQVLLLAMLNLGEPVYDTRQDFNEDCVLYLGQQKQGSQYRLEFYSTCSDSVFLRVCVDTGRMDPIILSSYGKLRAGGRTYLYTPPGEVPFRVHWKSNPDDPEVPAPCE